MSEELVKQGEDLAQAFHDGVNAGMEAGAELMNKLAREAVLEAVNSLPRGTFARRELEKLHGRIEMLTVFPEDVISY